MARIHLSLKFRLLMIILVAIIGVAGVAPSALARPVAVSSAADTIGVYRRSNHTFYLSSDNQNPVVAATITIGDDTSYPVIGDWNGDGMDSVGLYYQQVGVFALYDSNVQNAPISQAFVFGNPGDTPLAGRWVSALQSDPIGQLGRAHDGVGVFRSSNGLIYLISAWPQPPNLAVFSDYVIVLGNPGWKGLAGRWNAGALDTAAVYNPADSHFYMTSQSCEGLVTPGPNTFCLQFSTNDTYFGTSRDEPLKGDFAGSGKDGIGVFDPTTGIFSLLNAFPVGSGTHSTPDLTVSFGAAGDIPVAGHFPFRAIQPTVTPTDSPSPTVRPSSTVGVTPTTTPTLVPSTTALPSKTLTLTSTPVFTTTATPTNTSQPSVTLSTTTTLTVSPFATSIPPTAGPSPTRTNTVTPTLTSTTQPTLTLSPIPSQTVAPTFTATYTRTSSVTPSPTLTRSVTPPRTFTPTPTHSATPNPTATSTSTSTPANATPFPTATASPTAPDLCFDGICPP